MLLSKILHTFQPMILCLTTTHIGDKNTANSGASLLEAFWSEKAIVRNL